MKNFLNEIVHQKYLQKTSNFVWAPCERYQDIRHILQNAKLPRNTIGFNNHNISHETHEQPLKQI